MEYCKIEQIFHSNGFKCVASINVMGVHCGYVGVPKDHVLYGVDCFSNQFRNYGLSCHGGITYSGDANHLNLEDDELWYIGFDCGHAYDERDFGAAFKAFSGMKEQTNMILSEMLNRRHLNHSDWEVRTLDYVLDECKFLARQLKKMKNLNKYIVYKKHNLVAKYKYSEEDECYIGKITNVPDLILFHCDTEAELIRDFNEISDNYASFCAEIHKPIPYLWIPVVGEDGEILGMRDVEQSREDEREEL